MADILPSVTETEIFTALRSVIQSVVGCEVIRTQVNRVSMPAGDFIALTPISAVPLSTNVDAYTDTQKTIERPTEFTVQVDCYGAKSADRAASVAAILRDTYATDQFTALGYDMQTLYAGDAKQMPLTDGEDQFLERWTFDAVMQINPVVTLTQETANTLTVDLINVDATYPP